MLERSPRDAVIIAAPTALPAWRPVLFFLCVGLTMTGLIWLAGVALSPGGIGLVDVILVALFAGAEERLSRARALVRQRR